MNTSTTYTVYLLPVKGSNYAADVIPTTRFGLSYDKAVETQKELIAEQKSLLNTGSWTSGISSEPNLLSK